MPDLSQVNWLAVAIAAATRVVIGFVWYSPAVFGRRWAAAVGRDLPRPVAIAPLADIGSVIQGLVMAYVLALFAGGAGIAGGLVVAGLVWLGFVATTTLSVVVYEGRSVEYWAIRVGYLLASLLTMGAILGFFPATM